MAGLIILFFLVNFAGSVTTKTFKYGDDVTLFVNKVGPYHNTHETYHYYELPLCRPHEVKHKSLSLGELLKGDRMAYSDYKVNFATDKGEKTLCTLELSQQEVNQLKSAIEDLYYYEFVIDEISVKGFIGSLEEGNYVPHRHAIKLFTHHSIYLEYNDDTVVFANISNLPLAPNHVISLDKVDTFPFVFNFTYSVQWKKSTLKRGERMQKARETGFFPETFEIHWLSIINSVVLIFLLIAFVLFIMARVLKKDFAKYNLEGDEPGMDDDDDNGWKILHSDVFRFPKHKSLFCAVLGVGSQFLIIATCLLLMALAGMFNVHRHASINTASVLLYALTSCVSGYVATNMYVKMSGVNWVWNINLTSALFAGPFFLVWSVLNSLAWFYHSTQALPWGTVILLAALWLFLGYPLTIIGGIFGKNVGGSFDAPCRTKNIAREIPSVPFYKSAPAHCIVGGFLPFSAISVELYYIFSTIWGHEYYTLYGVLSVVYIILLSVTACVSVALTYFQLSAEDYRWWWRSIFSSGSTGVFVLAYSLYYYINRSSMSGLLQTAEFFGYTILACYIFFLMLGTVAFFASLKFVKYIFVNVKID